MFESKGDTFSTQLFETQITASFCKGNTFNTSEMTINRDSSDKAIFDEKKEPFSPQLFGSQAVSAKKNVEFMVEMSSFIKRKMEDVVLLNDKTSIYYSGTDEFEGYFLSTSFEKYPDVKSHSMMVIKDNTDRKFDLIFTTDGIVSVIKDKVVNRTPYDEVKLKGESISLYRGEIIPIREYRAYSFDIHVLYILIEQLSMRTAKNIDARIEYIDGVVTPAILNKWFKERKDAMSPNVTRIYAVPSEEYLKSLGYPGVSLDQEKNLIQCYYETNTGNILGFRVIHFECINSNLQTMLIEAKDGMIKV